MRTTVSFGKSNRKTCNHVICAWSGYGRFKYPEWREISWLNNTDIHHSHHPMLYDTVFNFCPACGKDIRKLIKKLEDKKRIANDDGQTYGW